MATVFMKWLEKNPENYDRGIRLITLGRLAKLQRKFVDRYVVEGARVLEIGCGSGDLAIAMANRGAYVTAIDRAPAMLGIADRKVKEASLSERVDLRHMDASLIGDRFQAGTFDLIVSSLAFSEMTAQEQLFILGQAKDLLAPEGKVVILDEVVPQNLISRTLISLVRFPIRVLTWLLTRETTHPLKRFPQILERAGFQLEMSSGTLLGSLQVFSAQPTEGSEIERLPASVLGRLVHRTNLRTIFLDLWGLLFRIIPPYPKVNPGLYAFGNPDPDSPVLVTGNFDLTIRRLVKALHGKVEAWILVVDTAGINVWCAAGGGYMTSEKVINAVRVNELDGIVKHRRLILPQLCANGVDGWRVRQEIKWGVHWGPALAVDLPEYLITGRQKSDAMRWVSFPLKDRLEMVTVTLGFYGLLILLPILIFWRHLFWSAAFSLVGLSYFYAIVLPYLPGRDGLAKAVPLTMIALSGLLVYTALWDPVPGSSLFNRAVGITALSVFTAAELQGMSPLMRGEQANWGWEAAIGGVLALSYWLVPKVVGWS